MNKKSQKTISVKQNILKANASLGDKIRQTLDSNRVLGLNIMASPGAGKTSLILRTIQGLKDRKMAIIEGDVVDIDVKRIAATGTEVVLANTGGDCHLDAVMVQKALDKIDLTKIDILLVENVGNLVCPAGFFLGTHQNVVIGSIPEGDDKPYKYPGMYKGADVVILNKVDYQAYQPFDVQYFSRGVKQLNPEVSIFPLSCRTGEGMEAWLEWIKEKLK